MRWKLELAVIVIVLFAVVLAIAPKQNMLSITGFLSTGMQQRQQVNLQVTQSSSFILKNVASAQRSLTYFSIAGSIVGEGAAQVFLKSGDRQLLVYSNIHKKKTGLMGITGNFVDIPESNGEKGESIEIAQGNKIQTAPTVPEGYETAEESFKDSCVESCALPVEFYNSASYTLEVLVSPGTTLNIDEIDFILAKE